MFFWINRSTLVKPVTGYKLLCTLFRMAKPNDESSKKKKRERKKRVVTTVSGDVISAKQLELAEKMSVSLEARESVFERDTQYPRILWS